MNNQFNNYWLVFGEGKHFFCKFLKPRFQHVFVVWKNEYGWHYLNPCSYGLETNPLPCLLADDVPGMYRKQGYEVMGISVPYFKKKFVRHGIHLTTCVGIVKYFLGLDSWAITPYGLYKALVRQAYDYRTGISITLYGRQCYGK